MKTLKSVILFILILSLSLGLPFRAYALPEGAQVVSGGASFQKPDPSTMNITTSDKVIINYNSFNIARPETVNFIQPDANSVALNRVVGGNPSEILGNLNANGQVFLVNPNGIFFGPGSKIDCGSFVASTLDISNDNFLSGNYQFSLTEDYNPSYIINRGDITVSPNGYCVLVSPLVSNEGNIIAELGQVVIAGTTQTTLSFDDKGIISFVIPELEAEAQAITIPQNQVSDVIKQVVNCQVLVEAGEVSEEDGVIRLVAAEGIAINSGTIHADVINGNAGNINLYANNIVVLTPESLITANAILNGNGGRVIVSSPKTALFWTGALIEVRGGELSGNGGFTEVSGKESFVVSGLVDARAPNGLTGKFLIDPYNVTISGDADANPAAWPPGTSYAPTGTPCNLNDATLEGQLALASIEITTVNGAGAEDGNIMISASIDYNGANTLTLTADDDIVFSTGGGIDFSGGGASTLSLTAGNTTADGAITNTKNRTITLDANDNLRLVADAGIGSAANPVLTSGLTDVAATTATGGIYITNSGDSAVNITTVTTVGITATTSGDIQIINSANGTITNVQQVNATSGSVSLSCGTAAGTGTIDAQAAVTAGAADGTGTISLTAPDGVTITAVTVSTNNGTITIDADSDDDNTGTFITLALPGPVTPSILTTTSDNAITITAADFTLVAGGTIDSDTGVTTLQPSDVTRTIGIADAAQNNINLTDAELDTVTSDNITIASILQVGDITIGTDGALTQGAKNFEFITKGILTTTGASFTTTGDITFTANSMVISWAVNADDVTLRPVTAARTIDVNDATGGQLSITDGELDLIGASGTITIGRSDAGNIYIGSVAGLSQDEPLTFDTGATIIMNNGITTTGTAVTLSDNTQLNTNITIDTTNTGGFAAAAVTISGTVDSEAAEANSLTIDADSAGGKADVTITGAIGTTVNLSALTITGNDISIDDIGGPLGAGITGATSITAADGADTGSITLTGTTYNTGDTQTYNAGAATNTITLGGGGKTTFTTSDDAIAFTGLVDGGVDLTINSGSAATTFNQAVGSATPIGDGVGAALTINSTGTTSFESTLATASGITQAGTAGTITFKGNVTIAAGDTASTFNASVTLDGLTLQSGGDVTFGNAGTDTVTLSSGDVSIVTTGAGDDLTVNSLVDGARDLSLDVIGTTTFNAAVGATTPIGDGTGAALTINPNGGNGAVSFESTLATASGIAQASGAITFKDDVTIAAGDTATTFDNNIVLDGLTFTSSAVTFGTANVDNTVTLSSATVTITTAAANANQTYNSLVDGAQGLTITTGTRGNLTFNAGANIGATTAPTSITTTSNNATFQNGTSSGPFTINYYGTLTYGTLTGNPLTINKLGGGNSNITTPLSGNRITLSSAGSILNDLALGVTAITAPTVNLTANAGSVGDSFNPITIVTNADTTIEALTVTAKGTDAATGLISANLTADGQNPAVKFKFENVTDASGLFIVNNLVVGGGNKILDSYRQAESQNNPINIDANLALQVPERKGILGNYNLLERASPIEVRP